MEREDWRSISARKDQSCRALSARLGSLHLTEWMHRSSDSRNSRVMWSDLRSRRIVLVVGLEGDKQDEPLGVCLGVSIRKMSCEWCLMNKCASEYINCHPVHPRPQPKPWENTTKLVWKSSQHRAWWHQEQERPTEKQQQGKWCHEAGGWDRAAGVVSFLFASHYFAVSFLLFFPSFWPFHMVCGVLVPQPGIEHISPAMEAQSLNHWTSK